LYLCLCFYLFIFPETPPNLDGHIICDLGKGLCDDVRIDGSGFINTTELSCRRTANGNHLTPTKAAYVNSKLVRCHLGTNNTGSYEIEVCGFCRLIFSI
jgi:hypothetical protein